MEAKHRTIERFLRERIETGQYDENGMIESENELVKRFQVSRVTARQALATLEADGLIARRQGKGSMLTGGAPLYRGRMYNRVGVISLADAYDMFEPLQQGVVSQLEANGYEVILLPCEESAQHERACLLRLLSEKLDGLVIEGIVTGMPTPNMDLYNRITEMNLPIVFTDGYHAGVRAAHILVNDRDIVRRMVEHLADLGHTRIGGIFCMTQIQGISRYQGYVDGLCENGLEYCDDRVLLLTTRDRKYVFDNLYNAYRSSILDSTAMVCYSDFFAHYLAITLLRDGIMVPDKISVTGLDDVRLPLYGRLRLTTAAHPKAAMGRQAAQMLHTMITTRRTVENEVMDMTFVPGNTTAQVHTASPLS